MYNLVKTAILIALVLLAATVAGCADNSQDTSYSSVKAAYTYQSPEFPGDQYVYVLFMDASTGNVTSYSWDFGDGTSSDQQCPGHKYNESGTYKVSLTVNGPTDKDTASKDVTVRLGGT